MVEGDPFESGKQKYQSATDIYDALQAMETGEEIGILAEMFADVSWDGQDYYYTENASKLVQRWDRMTDCGDKMWVMDVAAWQLTDEDANEWIYEILCNDDLAKRIGFKKLFIENVLCGSGNQYKSATEAFEEELRELDRFDYYGNMTALSKALASMGWQSIMNSYRALVSDVYKKLKGLRLDEERQLIAESRAMLTGYDDFMFGLRSNQALYQEQERAHQSRIALLQKKYDSAIQMLLSMAQEQGIVLKLSEAPLQLSASNEEVSNG